MLTVEGPTNAVPGEGRMTVQIAAAEATTTRKVLVLAMPNVRCEELLRSMRSRAGEAVRSSPVVPAVPLGLDWLADMSAGREIAEQQLSHLLSRCSRAAQHIAE